MKRVLSFHTVLTLVLLATLGVSVFLFDGADSKHKDFVTALPGILAVVAAIVAAWPTVKMFEMQRDALRPSPTPCFDFGSRYGLLLLRVKNLGASVAYDVTINWDEHPKNEDGEDVTALDSIPSLMPAASASINVGRPHELFKKYKAMQFSGVVEFRDVNETKYQQGFKFRADEQRASLTYDDEMTRTLYELQKLPNRLEVIAKAVKEAGE
ncbi:MAG: hypothetical protein JNL98_27490 [Bryobacterales bacterium]|nr:hypothetical protein [Bryobacterales bacterium]